ncbi:hypothetical protein HK099_007458, partial [Clydaea vesicula]
MSSWFYTPYTLPKTYVKWISKMADMDESLLQVLRLIKGKELIYGKNTGHEGVLLRYTKEIGLDPSFADPALGQISCLVVHGGIKGCEKFALYTFFK